MINKNKVIKGIDICLQRFHCGEDCPYCPYYDGCDEIGGCMEQLREDTLAILKEHKARELTIDEWREWKNNQKRDPICMLWENDTSPIWVLDPNDIHEPAFLMGKLKLFTGKPTFEQCKKVKWK